MAMVIGVLALMVATAALVVGMLTHSELTAMRGNGIHPTVHPHGHPFLGKRGTPSAAADAAASEKMTYEQRVDQAVTQKQYDNFMTYDGGEQDPIDRTTILADSGE